MEWLEKSWQRQGEEIAALHEEARKLRAEIKRLRADMGSGTKIRAGNCQNSGHPRLVLSDETE